MEHGDSSRGSRVSALGEGDGAPSHRRRLNPGIASSSGYGLAQNAEVWGVSTLLQVAREELATVKATVTSLEEVVALAHLQRTEPTAGARVSDLPLPHFVLCSRSYSLMFVICFEQNYSRR
jgi:hypothetical protein